MKLYSLNACMGTPVPKYSNMNEKVFFCNNSCKQQIFQRNTYIEHYKLSKKYKFNFVEKLYYIYLYLSIYLSIIHLLITLSTFYYCMGMFTANWSFTYFTTFSGFSLKRRGCSAYVAASCVFYTSRIVLS